MTDLRSKIIEAMARGMCREEFGDPDAIVTVQTYSLQAGYGSVGKARWTTYVDLAEPAFDAIVTHAAIIPTRLSSDDTMHLERALYLRQDGSGASTEVHVDNCGLGLAAGP